MLYRGSTVVNEFDLSLILFMSNVLLEYMCISDDKIYNAYQKSNYTSTTLELFDYKRTAAYVIRMMMDRAALEPELFTLHFAIDISTTRFVNAIVVYEMIEHKGSIQCRYLIQGSTKLGIHDNKIHA